MKDFILKLDKERALRFGFKSLALIKDQFGIKSLDKLISIEVDEIPAVVYAGLKWKDEDLTIEKVVDLLDDAIPEKYTIIGITTLVLQALASQMGVEIDIKKVTASNLKKAEKRELDKKKKQKVKLKTPSSKKRN